MQVFPLVNVLNLLEAQQYSISLLKILCKIGFLTSSGSVDVKQLWAQSLSYFIHYFLFAFGGYDWNIVWLVFEEIDQGELSVEKLDITRKINPVIL